MSLKVACEKCRSELDEPGGIALSPPTPMNFTVKLHLCVSCWQLVLDFISEEDLFGPVTEAELDAAR